MATVLSIYNASLRMLREGRLSATSDDIPARYLLDDAITDVKEVVLEKGQWNFASRSTSVAGSASSNRGFSYRFTKPTDFVRLIAISESSSYYPPAEKYDEDATYWYSNATTIYITYVSDDASYGGDLTKWPESYADVVAACLAVEIGPTLTKSEAIIKRCEAIYEQALQFALAKDAINRTVRVLSSSTESIYKEALRLVGKRLLTNFDDDFISRRIADVDGEPATNQSQGRAPQTPADEAYMEMKLRRLLDECYDEIVAYLLSEGLWNFGQRTVALEYETSIEPAFGYQYAFEIPTDLVRIVAVSQNGELFPPLNDYLEEGDYYHTNCSVLYLQYVSNHADYGLDTAKWTPSFKKALAAHLAVEIAPTARMPANHTQALKVEANLRLKNARTKDAMDQSIAQLPSGRLVRSRGGLSGSTSRDMRRA